MYIGKEACLHAQSSFLARSNYLQFFPGPIVVHIVRIHIEGNNNKATAALAKASSTHFTKESNYSLGNLPIYIYIYKCLYMIDCTPYLTLVRNIYPKAQLERE